MKVTLEEKREAHMLYFDAGSWAQLERHAQEISQETGRRVTASRLVRLAVKDLLKKLNQ